MAEALALSTGDCMGRPGNTRWLRVIMLLGRVQSLFFQSTATLVRARERLLVVMSRASWRLVLLTERLHAPE